MSAYTRTTWVDGVAPPISAANLNNIEAGLVAAAAQAGTGVTSVGAGVGLTVAGTPTAPTLSVTPGIFATTATLWFNVRDPAYGAKGDGVTDDTAAFVAVRTAAPAGSLIYIPAGTYIVTDTALYLSVSNIIYRGAFNGATTIKVKAAAGVATFSFNTGNLSRVAFENITFDGNNATSQGLIYSGNTASDIRYTQCRFIRMPVAGALSLQTVTGATVEDCIFDDQGAPTMTGITIGASSRDIEIRRNRFLWVKNAILTSAALGGGSNDGPVVENLRIHDNYFDLGWFLLPFVRSNSGGTVTYTAAVLTDTAASFVTDGVAANDYVRVMPVVATGTATAVGPTSLTDSGANFTTVRRGQIIRTGGLFAVVAGRASSTVIVVEAWWDDVTRAVVAPPALGTYTVYDMQHGHISAVTATTLTATFVNLDGVVVTPSAGTRYEMMRKQPVYPINLDYSTRFCHITNNVVRRGYGDQISIFGSDCIVANNFIEYGQDEGITIIGTSNVVTGNYIRHQGSGGIFAGGFNSSFTANVFGDGLLWTNIDPTNLGCITVAVGATGHTISANRMLTNTTAPAPLYGINVKGNSMTLVGNIVSGNAAGYRIAPGVTGTVIDGNVGPVLDLGTGTISGLFSNSTGVTGDFSARLAAATAVNAGAVGPGGASGLTFQNGEAGSNFYRSSVGTLRIDGNLVMGTGASGLIQLAAGNGWYISSASARAGATDSVNSLSLGTGAPNNANGANGDFYLNGTGAVNNRLFLKIAGTWTGIV